MIDVRVNSAAIQARAAALRSSLDPAALNALAGRAIFNLIIDHLRLRNQTPNALGGRRTNFYSKAADSTSLRHDATAAVVSIAQTGIRLRLKGGTVVPINRQALTIPIHPAAHGMRASDFPDIFKLKTKAGHAFLADKTGGELRLLFILKKSATNAPDPTVLPSAPAMQSAALSAIRSHLHPS